MWDDKAVVVIKENTQNTGEGPAESAEAYYIASTKSL